MITRDNLLENKPLVIAGPCSASSREELLKTAYEVKKMGAQVFRAGLWKARTCPDSFQGVGDKGLKWLMEIKEKTGLLVTVEIQDSQQVDLVRDVSDILWVGSRNMQNFELLKKIGEDPRPVILKRGFISTIKEWLGAATYMGLDKVILCERGVRTGADAMRFTLDLNAMLVAKHDYGVPVIVDPSHTAGRRDMVGHLACAGIAAGADGIIVETSVDPEVEQVDRDQTISTEDFGILMNRIYKIYST
ncbi:3-deoxy-7-phosphoheptulonate synthase [Candidatus Dojkabacteria bacterium]|nr:3-deoxy-7-phosphoheptulonate synthase [Candidatus Dojkabacteria bacterium]